MSGWAIEVSYNYDTNGRFVGFLYQVGYMRSRAYDKDWIEDEGGFDDEFIPLFETYDHKSAAQMCHYLNGGEADIDSLFERMEGLDYTGPATVMTPGWEERMKKNEKRNMVRREPYSD